MHQNNNPAVVTPQLFLGLGVHPPELTFPPDVLRGSTAAFISNQERYVEIIAMDVSHDSATARIVQMLLRSPEAQNVFVARWTNMAAVLAAGQPSGFEPVLARPTAGAGSDRLLPGHPLVIPPGWNLQMSGNTAGAAYSIFVSIAYIAHPISERRFYP